MRIELAGITLEVNTPHLGELRPLLSEYAAKDAGAGQGEPALVGIEVTECDILAQVEKTRRAFEALGEERAISDLECEFTALYKKILRRLVVSA